MSVNPGTTSRLTRRKRLFSWVRRRTHELILVGLNQPDPNQSKTFMFMCLFSSYAASDEIT